MALGEFEMSSRIPGHGGLVNSSKPLTFQFNGKELEHSVPKISGTRYSILFYMI